MYTGFSTNAFTKKPLLDTINLISKIGYDGIELVLDHPHAYLPLKNEFIKKIKNSILVSNLLVSNLNANTVLGWYNGKNNVEKFEPSLSNPDKKLRLWRISYTKKAIELAEILDSPSISITSGIKNSGSNKEKQAFFKKLLVELAEFAETKNILLGIEYEPGLLIETSEDVYRLSNDFKNIGLNLDTCHAAVLDENFPELIKKFRNKIFHTHISDCQDSIHYHLIPGYGEINFHEIYQSLKDVNYNGFLTAELYTYLDMPEKAARDTFMFLRNLQK